MNRYLIHALRAVISGLQIVSPALAGRFAFRLFCFVPRGKPPGERERALLGTDFDRLLDGQRVDIPFEGGRLATWRFAARAGGSGTERSRRVVLIHGFRSSSIHLSAFIEPLLAAGFGVVAFDLPAHGGSSGRSIHLLRGVRALEALHAETGPWHGVVGHSFGGMIATTALAGTFAHHQAIPVDRLALIATPENLRAILERVSVLLGLDEPAQSVLQSQVEALAGKPIDAFRGSRQLRSPPRPTLVVHSADDREIAVADADALLSAGAHMRSLRLDGLGHRRILYSRDVITAVVSHLH